MVSIHTRRIGFTLALGSVLSVSSVWAVGCSGADVASPVEEDLKKRDAGGVDASADAKAADAGKDAVAPFTPANHDAQFVIPNQGGPILPNPEIVTVTWAVDPLAGDLQRFDDWIGGSAYWKAISQEYGIHAATHPATWTAPKLTVRTLDDSDIAKILLDGIASKSLRAPTDNTIYTIYPPAGIAITMSGSQGCTEFQAYHLSTATPAGQRVVYAVMPRCAQTQGQTPLDFTTWGSSHEIVEAATDPIFDRPAFRSDGLNGDPAGENADLCTGFPLKIEGHTVTANYSNAAAKADQRPCVPAAPGPMFGIAPATTNLTIARGTTVDLAATFYSNGPMSESLTLGAFVFDSHVTVTADTARGINGDKITLHFKADSQAGANGPTTAILSASINDYHTNTQIAITVK